MRHMQSLLLTSQFVTGERRGIVSEALTVDCRLRDRRGDRDARAAWIRGRSVPGFRSFRT